MLILSNDPLDIEFSAPIFIKPVIKKAGRRSDEKRK